MKKLVLLALLGGCYAGVGRLQVPTGAGPVKRGDIISQGGIARVVHSGEMTGNGTLATPLGLTTTCLTNEVLVWSGTAWVCSSTAADFGTGTTNTLAMWTGTDTLGDSPLLYNGSTLITTVKGITADSGLRVFDVAGAGLTSSTNTIDVGAGLGILSNANDVAIDPTYTQRRVTGTCSDPFSPTAINQDGTVVCSTTTASMATGTNNQTLKRTGTRTIGDAWPSDDATTWGVASRFTITEANGNFRSFGTGTIDGAATLSSTLTVASTAIIGGTVAVPTLGPVLQSSGTTPLVLGRANSANANGPNADFYRTRGADVSTHATVANADVLGNLRFDADDGTNVLITGLIRGIVNGTVSTGVVPTDLVFQTSATNTAGLAIALTLKSDQSALFGGQLDFGSHKGVNVTNGSNPQDAVAFNQLATAVNAAVSGTSGRSARFNGTNTIGNGAFLDGGTNASIAGTLAIGPTFTAPPNSRQAIIDGAEFVDVNARSQLAITSTTAFGSSPAAGIAFGVRYDATPNYSLGATIQGFKENTTSGDFSEGLRFTTQRNSASPQVALVLDSNQGMEAKGAATLDSTAHIVGALTEDATVSVESDAFAVLSNKTVLVKGANTNASLAGGVAALDLQVGRDNTGALVNANQTTADVAFSYGSGSGGYRHWISTNHGTTATTANAMNFWLNTSASAGTSTAPGTGNAEVLSLYGDTSAKFYGALSVNGNTTLGDASSDTTTVNGSIVATNLPASQSVASGVNIANPNTAQTATGEVIYAHSNGSFNTTSGNLINYIVYAEAHATRSSGSNVLTNIAGFFDATSAQTNVAIYTGAGDVDLNQTSGVLNAHGAATLDSTLGVTGDTTVNKLTVNGKASDNSATINFTQTAQTLSLTALTLSNTGTFNTTGGVLTSSGGSFSVTSTRSSGANNLVNRAGYFNASGAQVNQGLYVDNGDVVLNNTSGTTLVTGHGSTTGDLRAADATAVSGTGVANQVLAVSRTGSSARSTTTAATLNDAINVAVSGAPTGSCVGHESNCGVLNRAIYATASGGDTAYSGYFDTGNFYVHGDTSFDAANFTVSGANETFGSTLANVSFTILSNGATYTFDNTHVDLNKNTTISAGNFTVTSGTATIGGATTLSSTVSAAGTITASNGIAGNNGYGGKHLEWNDEWMGSTAQSAGFSTEDIGSPPYQILETGTGTGIADVTGVTQRPGIIQLITGTVSTGDVAVVTSPNSVNFGDGVWTWEQTVGWQTLSTGTQEYASLMGFFDTPSGVNQTDGCYFLYDRGNVATGGANGTNTHNLEAVCVSNGTRTVFLLNGSGNCDASFAKGTVTIAALTYPNTNIRRLKIVENSTSDVGFYADGTQVCKITTNIPTGSTRLTGAGWAIIKSVGVTASTMDTDQTRLAVDLTSARSP